MSNLESVLTILVAGLTSTNAWQYYQKKIQLEVELQQEQKKEKRLYQDKLADEVAELKNKLSKIYIQRETELRDMNEKILELSKAVARMNVKIEFLETENNSLKGM